MKKLFSLVLLSSLLVYQQATFACGCGSEILGGAGFGGPIITIPAYTLPKGKFALSAGLQYNDVDQFSTIRLNQINRNREHTHTFDSEMTTFISAAYGINDNLNILASLPYRFTNDIQTTFAGVTIDDGDSIGLGDLTLLGKYKFLELEDQKIHAALLGGIRIPTGETDERNEFGFKLGADDQPGTGSWDPLMGLALSKQYNNFSFDTNVLYRLSTQGSQDTTVGDSVNFNAAVSYSVSKYHKNRLEKLFPNELFGQSLNWGLILEMNGVWNEKVEFAGVKDDSHGGLTIFASPGLRLALNEDLVMNFSVGLPVIDDLNGIQPDNNLQLFFGINKIF